tara:strand:- start:1166 stop:2026 length:861 start_codon:yes stop_codon:yes gene_type:complete
MNLFNAYQDISINHQLIFSAFFISFFGIPHGAIDNIIARHKTGINNIVFYIIYLLVLLIFLSIWYMAPDIAFWTFLLISAYHFGESQLVSLFKSNKYNHFVFLLWGTWLIVCLMYFNSSELEEIGGYSTIFSVNKNILSILPIVFFITSISLFSILILLSLIKNLTLNHLFQELFTLGLVALTFYIFPFVIGFTLYFVVLHSIRVMYQEYDFLKSRINKLSYSSFIKLLLPNTIMFLFGLVIFLLLYSNNYFTISLSEILIVSISCVTVPHAFVMMRFYKEQTHLS